MTVRTYRRLEGGVYAVTVQTEDWSAADKALMAQYAEPAVATGGSFADEYTEFTLPEAYARVMTESPFTARFDGRDFDNAEDRALLWQDTVIERLSAAVTALRALADTFTGEEVVQI